METVEDAEIFPSGAESCVNGRQVHPRSCETAGPSVLTAWNSVSSTGMEAPLPATEGYAF